MRFKITMQIDHSVYGNVLPINYQYELSSWIYHTIAKGDQSYADWLHENGFSDRNKRFKLFVFSNLYIADVKQIEDRLFLSSNQVHFYVSFLPERSTSEFIKGVFLGQEFTIGDKKSKVQFRVRKVEMLSPPVYSDSMKFKTLSPVVVSCRGENGNIQYISPETEGYGQLLINNLKEKYLTFYGKSFDGNQDFCFELLSPAKSRLVKIKANTPQETLIRGYNFEFRLQADTKLLKMMYEAGIFEKNSTGFGFVITAQKREPASL